jgi:hypothetical protein
MTTDDQRIRYLSGDDGALTLDDAERIDLDGMRALLADRTLWAEPPAGLEDAVVTAVSAEATARSTAVRSPAARRGRPRAGRFAAVVGAVAAAAVVLAVVVGTRHDTGRPELATSLHATGLVPGAEGHATFTRTDSGWRIDLDATGLPRLDDGRFYQGWLRNGAGAVVAIGTFNEPDDVVLWAGVRPLEFPTLTVTQESADGDPTPSDRAVLVGAISQR